MPLSDHAIDEFIRSFPSEVLRPADPGFPQARAEAIWNGAITRRPALIVRPASAEEVASTVAFARDAGAEVTVRGGGHSTAGAAVAEGAVMIDLSRMNRVRVDADARRAWVGAGASLADLDAATAEHGLAVVAGLVSHTGVAGLTLTGGVGWLTSQQGLSCDNLVEATLVAADGRIVTVSDQAHPDLMWALRGAGTNFGVVTELVFALHEVNPLANFGLFFWRAEDAADPLAFAQAHLHDLPDGMGAAIAAMSAPPEPFVPEEHRGRPGVAVMVVGWGSPEEHAAAVAPLRERGPLFELVTPIPYAVLQQTLDNAEPWGIRAYAKSLNFEDLPEEAIGILLDRLPHRRSPMTYVPMIMLRGRFRQVADDATAWGSSRRTRWAVALLALAPDEESHTADRAWVRDLWEALRPYASAEGAYLNFESETDERRVRASYGEEKFRRLAALKAEWDPDNVFRHNPNIPPTPAGIPTSRKPTPAGAEEPIG
jgi:FAD/FMN-containing dehydrogenase